MKNQDLMIALTGDAEGKHHQGAKLGPPGLISVTSVILSLNAGKLSANQWRRLRIEGAFWEILFSFVTESARLLFDNYLDWAKILYLSCNVFLRFFISITKEIETKCDILTVILQTNIQSAN